MFNTLVKGLRITRVCTILPYFSSAHVEARAAALLDELLVDTVPTAVAPTTCFGQRHFSATRSQLLSKPEKYVKKLHHYL